MAGGSAIRGSRVGAGPMGEAERGEAAPRVHVSFWCAKGHETRPSFANDAPIPDTWDCPRCGWPAGPERDKLRQQVAELFHRDRHSHGHPVLGRTRVLDPFSLGFAQ